MEMITKDFIDEFRRFADNEVHPVVSPDNWHIYSQLIDFINELDESLKEQEAVIPDTNGYELVCGSCKYPVELERKTSPQTWFRSTLYNYCPNCGKKVKWDE